MSGTQAVTAAFKSLAVSLPLPAAAAASDLHSNRHGDRLMTPADATVRSVQVTQASPSHCHGTSRCHGVPPVTVTMMMTAAATRRAPGPAPRPPPGAYPGPVVLRLPVSTSTPGGPASGLTAAVRPRRRPPAPRRPPAGRNGQCQ